MKEAFKNDVKVGLTNEVIEKLVENIVEKTAEKTMELMKKEKEKVEEKKLMLEETLLSCRPTLCARNMATVLIYSVGETLA